ncbi:immunoglobulin domain-containing protein [Aquabacterium sp.]|uniref:immunoglobulin domain-containing protein n=1 Tax=Aquabacterium sp. TaxID=1872578 RepID=UPI002C755101|nr:immunoglobulin domain-containing protein [Aquabacterium sp.]HSW05281.1 immunoglobulin domain-containing protein [Aquabacterium sp.]
MSSPTLPSRTPMLARWAAVTTLTTLLASCGGGGGSAGAPLEPTAVVISTQPANQAVVSGQSASFSVVATGNGSLSYQWRLNGADVAGANAVNFTPQALETTQDNAQVSVRVSDIGGSRVSNAATLRVYSPTNLPAPTVTDFEANATEAVIDAAFGAHIATSNSILTPKGRLFVFLPASLSVPSRTQLVLNAAANNGLHAIGLAYPNDVVLDSACSGASDAACWGNAREEIRSGSNVSANVAVNEANAIEHRLLKALQYLVQTQPTRGWEQYLDNGTAVRWDRVRIAGHSQGGGHAAYIATKRPLDRACLFSSPADYDDVRQQPAAWLSATSATPASKLYGFSHQRDMVVGINKLQSIWSALGMAAFGGLTLIDDVPLSAYQGRHMLYTDRPVVGGISGQSYHGAPVVDLLTPIDSVSGLPAYWPIWQYACFL